MKNNEAKDFILVILSLIFIAYISACAVADTKNKITKRTAWVTAYYPPERSAYRDALGNRCTLRTASSNKLPIGAKIWVKGAGYRVVTDTGGRSNDTVARKKGAELWIDLWYPHSGMWATKVTQYKIISKPPVKKKKAQKKR